MNVSDLIEKQYGVARLPDDPAYAMAYVPFQEENEKLYSPDQGFALGTMYPALNKPFFGSKCGETQ